MNTTIVPQQTTSAQTELKHIGSEQEAKRKSKELLSADSIDTTGYLRGKSPTPSRHNERLSSQNREKSTPTIQAIEAERDDATDNSIALSSSVGVGSGVATTSDLLNIFERGVQADYNAVTVPISPEEQQELQRHFEEQQRKQQEEESTLEKVEDTLHSWTKKLEEMTEKALESLKALIPPQQQETISDTWLSMNVYAEFAVQMIKNYVMSTRVGNAAVDAEQWMEKEANIAQRKIEASLAALYEQHFSNTNMNNTDDTGMKVMEDKTANLSISERSNTNAATDVTTMTGSLSEDEDEDEEEEEEDESFSSDSSSSDSDSNEQEDDNVGSVNPRLINSCPV